MSDNVYSATFRYANFGASMFTKLARGFDGAEAKALEADLKEELAEASYRGDLERTKKDLFETVTTVAPLATDEAARASFAAMAASLQAPLNASYARATEAVKALESLPRTPVDPDSGATPRQLLERAEYSILEPAPGSREAHQVLITFENTTMKEKKFKKMMEAFKAEYGFADVDFAFRNVDRGD